MRRKTDGLFALGIIALVLFGAVMIYSASVIVGYTKFADPQYFFKREVGYAALGIVALVTAANIPYKTWQKNAHWMMFLSLGLLLSVFIFSRGAVNGAHRWIGVGSFTFQPSELVKFTFLAYLAAWFSQRRAEVKSFQKTFFPFLGILTVLSGLMLLEPDFGTLTVMLAGALAIFFTAGMTWKQGVVGLLCLGILGAVVLAQPYRRDRITAYLNPESDQSGVSYHVKNISIAIGTGSWFGLGFGESRQKRLFLPEPHTDSIFAIIVEELGFVIAGIMVLVLAFVLYRGYKISAHAPDGFSQLLVVGIITWFFYQAFLNLAAMLQLLPLKGVPLPFISYGGTNLIISLFAAGVVLNISRSVQHGEVPAQAVTPARRTKMQQP